MMQQAGSPRPGELLDMANLRETAFELGLLPFWRRRDAFAPSYLDALREAILRSPYLAESNLNYRFAGTQGYAVTFTTDGLPRVRQDFPEFAPYLDAALDARCNAFFLNPLVIGEVGKVAPHVDRSLRSFTLPDEPPNPRRVSVLYVDVPPGMRGGRLNLYHRLLPLASLKPRRNVLLIFQGFLRHAVTEVRGTGQAPRLSLVCEQYHLPGKLLARVPEFAVRSTSPFEAFLQAELKRGKGAEPPNPDAL
jgi:hypothetical protein